MICSDVLHRMLLPPLCWCWKHLRKWKKTAALIFSLQLDKFISCDDAKPLLLQTLLSYNSSTLPEAGNWNISTKSMNWDCFTFSHSSHTLSGSFQQVWNSKNCDKRVWKSESWRNAEPPVEYHIVVFLHLLVFAASFWRPMDGFVFCYHGTINVWQWHSGKCSGE